MMTVSPLFQKLRPSSKGSAKGRFLVLSAAFYGMLLCQSVLRPVPHFHSVASKLYLSCLVVILVVMLCLVGRWVGASRRGLVIVVCALVSTILMWGGLAMLVAAKLPFWVSNLFAWLTVVPTYCFVITTRPRTTKARPVFGGIWLLIAQCLVVTAVFLYVRLFVASVL